MSICRILLFILCMPCLLKGSSYDASNLKIGIEREIIFTLDKTLSASEIKEALQFYSKKTSLEIEDSAENKKGLLNANFDLRVFRFALGYSSGDKVFYKDAVYEVEEVLSPIKYSLASNALSNLLQRPWNNSNFEGIASSFMSDFNVGYGSRAFENPEADRNFSDLLMEVGIEYLKLKEGAVVPAIYVLPFVEGLIRREDLSAKEKKEKKERREHLKRRSDRMRIKENLGDESCHFIEEFISSIDLKSSRFLNELESSLHTDFGGVIEFIRPERESYREYKEAEKCPIPKNFNYFKELDNIKKDQDLYLKYLDYAMKIAHNAYARYHLWNSKYIDLLNLGAQVYLDVYRNLAYLYQVKKYYGASIIPSPFGTVKDFFEILKNKLKYTGGVQARSYHLSVNLPTYENRDRLEQALYSSYVLQWLEPVFFASFLSGNPIEGLDKGVSGSLRLMFNPFVNAGTTPLKICSENATETLTCFNRTKLKEHDRVSVETKQCYQRILKDYLLSQEREGTFVRKILRKKSAYFAKHPEIQDRSWGIDLKGKNYSSNVINFGDGFELRIFDNMELEDFYSVIEVFVLALAHSFESFGRDLNELEHVNLPSGQEDQSFLECEFCNEANTSPCNTWQIAMASLFKRSYRARLNLDYVRALEKNIDLEFYPLKSSSDTHVYAFEVVEALFSKLYNQYYNHEIVKLLLGKTLEQTPKVFLRKGFEEWKYYLDRDAEVSKKIGKLKEVLKNSHGVLSSFEFWISFYLNHLGSEWEEAYEDVLFYLQEEGLIDLQWKNAEIEKICVGCTFDQIK